ncbi:hypothetical protein BH24DEI2_BH24DEI2_02200 [soil metagenome]
MKKRFALVIAVLLTTLLASCTISGTFEGKIGLPPGLTITNATYGTDFEATVDGRLQDVICNDRTTKFSYGFNFDGDLRSWESYLKGVRTGEIAGRISLDLNSNNVGYDRATNRVTVTYEIRPNAAPQAIVVNPKVAGKSQLFLQFGTYNYKLLSDPVPILESCN